MSGFEVILVVLAAGVALRLIALIIGLGRLTVYRRNARPASAVGANVAELQFHIDVFPEIYLSGDIDGPITFGIFRPVILLPSRFLSLGPALQRPVICHELLHVRRRYWASTVIEELIRCFLWFHPAVWWMLEQIRLTREQIVDREVVQITKARQPYLDALLEIAGAKMRTGLGIAPGFLRKHHLIKRVALLMKEISMSRSRLFASLVTITAAVLLTVQTAVWSFPLQAQQRERKVFRVGEDGV